MTRWVIAMMVAGALCAPAALAPVPSLAQANQPQRAVDIDMDAVPKLAPDGVRKVQAALQKRGVSPGPIDGIFGPMTKEAVRTFQDRYGIKASGEVDNQTLFALGEPDLAT